MEFGGDKENIILNKLTGRCILQTTTPTSVNRTTGPLVFTGKNSMQYVILPIQRKEPMNIIMTMYHIK